MFKKKVFPLVGLLALGALVGCAGAAKQEEEKNKIYIWATAAEKAVIDKIVGDYNKTAEEKIAYEVVQISEADAGTSLLKDPRVKNAPALVLLADDQINDLVTQNDLAEVVGTYKTNTQTMNTAVAVEGATNSEKLYGFPITNDNGYFLYYDNTQLTATDVTSLETILQKARVAGKSVLMDVSNGWYANSFIMSPQACGTTSLQWHKDDAGKIYYDCNWDNEKGVEISTYIGGLLKPYYDDKTLVTGGNADISRGFEEQKLIAAVSGTWMEQGGDAADGAKGLSTILGDKLAAAKLPSYHIGDDAYQMTSFTGSKVYVVNQTRPAEEKIKAMLLGDLLANSKESQLIRYELRNTIPCNKEAMADARFTEHQTKAVAALSAQTAIASCVQSKTAESRYWNIGQAIGQAYLDGDFGTDGDNWGEFLYVKAEALRKHA